MHQQKIGLKIQAKIELKIQAKKHIKINITNYLRSAKQNYNEVSPPISQKGHHQKITKEYMLEGVWRKGKPPILLERM